MRKLIFLMCFYTGCVFASGPLENLQTDINELMTSANSRFQRYDVFNAKSKFPELPYQFICTYEDGNEIYALINDNNKIIDGLTDSVVKAQMITELRAFEQKLMYIAAWDLFIAANSNIKSAKQTFPQVLENSENYVPRWAAWLGDKTPESKINTETKEFNSAALENNQWQCQGDCLTTTLDLHVFSKEQQKQEGIQQGGHLIDQAGNPVYFESRANGLLYQRLTQAYTGNYPSNYPLGQCTTYVDIGPNLSGEAGLKQNIPPVVTVKLAWKVLTEKDNAAEYFSMQGVSLPNHESTKKVDLGMVAMHIAIKEQRQFNWRWVTFEHRNNLNEPAQGSSDTPSFYNPKCTDCCNNVYPKDNVPAQITRVTPIPEGIQTLNQKLGSLLNSHNSVFQHYKLVETQYTSLVAPNSDFLKRTPNDARNAVLEPYLLPDVSSCQSTERYVIPAKTFATGCMGCHEGAKFQTKNSKCVKADFTFISPLNVTNSQCE